ncbi:MAG: putative 7-carboxy-7-deazaguanine synthase QueE [Lachnospiraceae bacterium]|nr:putative 7-carboxy-7-deazaguanine synthase QueE [Lachnospiraceae bacterium]
MKKYNIVEKFISINGEGLMAGAPACFVRLAGCNLNCNYCDTAWANKPDVKYKSETVDEICSFVKASGVETVTLTGGEPLLAHGIEELIGALASIDDMRVEIETNGAVDISPFIGIGDNVCFTLDYKLPGSGMEEHMLTSNYAYLTKKDAVKFVCSDMADLERTRLIAEEFGLYDKTNVLISTVFNGLDKREVVDYLIRHKMSKARLQLQLHKYIWNPDERGV